MLPKSPARNLLDVDPADLAHVMQVAQKIAKASMKVFGADGITIQQFNESAGGQVVFHLHFHVLPRWTGVALRPPGIPATSESILGFRDKITAALAAA